MQNKKNYKFCHLLIKLSGQLIAKNSYNRFKSIATTAMLFSLKIHPKQGV